MPDFENLINRLPVGWEKLVAQGVNYLADELEADLVTMKKHPNGVSIAIRTDEKNIKKALKFWKEHVEPQLDGEKQ